MGSYLINRGRTAARYSPLTRSEHESPLGWTCSVCGELQQTWTQRIPPGTPDHQCTRLVLCRQDRCQSLYWAYIPPAWRSWAETWRPYQRLLDGLWTPGTGPEPSRPDFKTMPAPIFPRIARRSMQAQFCYYMLGPHKEIAGYIESIEIRRTDDPWDGVEEPVATIMVFFPHDPDDQRLLMEQIPAIRALHEESPLSPGEEIQIEGARRGMDAGNWWPLGDRVVTEDHRALADHLHPLPQIVHPTTPSPVAPPRVYTPAPPEATLSASLTEAPDPQSLPVLREQTEEEITSTEAAEVSFFLSSLDGLGTPPEITQE